MSVSEHHTLAGPYALDSVDPGERSAFEGHLQICPNCRQEVAEFAATAARLALAVSTTPPAGLKHAVLQQIKNVRQFSPGLLRRSLATTSNTKPSTQRVRRYMLAACVAAASLGGVATWQNQEARQVGEEANQTQASADRVAAILTAGDARTHAVSLPGGARGVVVTSAKQDRAVFTASGLQAPPNSKVYELWFDDSGTMRPAGFLDQTSGHHVALMEGAMNGATGVGITLEPAGGSRTPTLPAVAVIDFTA